MKCFNPRTRKGCDVTAAADVYAVLAVSIHAPVKGATYNRALFTASVKGFNPRTRKGCAVMKNMNGKVIKKFQSTHP